MFDGISPYILVIFFCGLTLLGLMLALVFSQKFRQDLSAKEGKLSLVGISIEGVAILLLFALLIGGMLYSLSQYKESKNDGASPDMSTVIKLSDLPFKAKSNDEAVKKIEQLHESSKNIKNDDIVTLVKNLQYHQKESKEIRSFPSNLIGPWRTTKETQAYFVTVPERIKPDEVRGCNEHQNKKFEIVAEPVEGYGEVGGRVEIEVNQVISVANDCSVKFDFLQITCNLANQLYSDNVVTCDQKGKPKWKITNRKLPVRLTPL